MEESWDLLTERCQKKSFQKNYKRFRQSQSDIEALEKDKVGKFKTSDIIPTERDFNVSVLKKSERKEFRLQFSLKKVEGHWRIINIDTVSTLEIRK